MVHETLESQEPSFPGRVCRVWYGDLCRDVHPFVQGHDTGARRTNESAATGRAEMQYSAGSDCIQAVGSGIVTL